MKGKRWPHGDRLKGSRLVRVFWIQLLTHGASLPPPSDSPLPGSQPRPPWGMIRSGLHKLQGLGPPCEWGFLPDRTHKGSLTRGNSRTALG